jgi:hypothetical protein
MIDYNNIRYPIVIVSTPRSGSTALTLHIIRKLITVPCFIEPEQSEESLNAFLSHMEYHKNYVVKIHVDNFTKYPTQVAQYLMKSEEPYRILMDRRGKIDQLVSFYIAKYRTIWKYNEGDTFKKDVIPINIYVMKSIMDFYGKQFQLVNEGYFNFDTTLIYEDCMFENTGMRTTPEPKNHQEIYDMFVRLTEGKIE